MKRSDPERISTLEIAEMADRFDDAYGRLASMIPAPLPKDVSGSDLVVLAHIAQGEGATLGWLAEHLELPKSTTSVLVKRLERERLVRRRRHAQDERRLEITLTPKGRRRVVASRSLDPKALTAALHALSARRRRTLIEAIEDLTIAAGSPA